MLVCWDCCTKKYHSLGGLHQRHLLPHSSEAPGRGVGRTGIPEASLLPWIAVFLGPHGLSSVHGISASLCVCKCHSPYGDISQIGLGLTLALVQLNDFFEAYLQRELHSEVPGSGCTYTFWGDTTQPLTGLITLKALKIIPILFIQVLRLQHETVSTRGQFCLSRGHCGNLETFLIIITKVRMASNGQRPEDGVNIRQCMG